jgi:uncharacterized protein (DUF302 family)
MLPVGSALSESTGRHFRTKLAGVFMGNNGIVRLRSTHSLDETVARVKDALASKGIALFAVIDHSGEAAKVGLKMPPTKLIIFGNPRAGTPLMLASPMIAIDLPLKILVSEDESGAAWISYNSPEYLQQRFDIPSNLLSNISGIEGLARLAAK